MSDATRSGRARRFLRIVLPARWLAFPCCLLLSPALQALTPLERDAYRADLVGLIGIVRDVRTMAGPAAPGSPEQVDRAVHLFATYPDADVDALAVSLPRSELNAIVGAAQGLLKAPRSGAAHKIAVAASPEVTPAFCNDYPAPVVFAALGTKLVTRHIIEAAEFTCHSSVLGFNGALGCEAPEIAAAAAEIASALADFCGNQQGAATNTAVLQTERSIGRHLDAQLDTPLSTRASQVSLDEAADDAGSADTLASDIQDRLDQDYVRIDARLDDALADLAGIAARINDIQSRTDDVAFRVQATQADVEDVQIRSADLQAKASELTASLEATRQVAGQLAGSSTTLAATMNTTARQQRRDDLAMALGDANMRVPGLALPATAGGRIEEAREVLIEAITMLQTIGHGNTASATASLAAGDAAYNTGQFTDAWRHYSVAYRVLDPSTGQDAGGDR